MTYGFSQGNAPGFTSAIESEEVQVLRAGTNGQDQASYFSGAILDDATVDSGNTPTTTIRGGRALGYTDSGGKLQLYGAPATDDGRDAFIGILDHYQDMLQQGVAADRVINVLKSGLVRSDALLGLDAAAKAVMARMGFVFDGLLPEGAAFLTHPVRDVRKSDNYTVTAADNGKCFIQTGADKTFTLPTIANGLSFEFINASSGGTDTMIIAATGAIMFDGSLAANSITGDKPGAHARVRAVYIGTSTLKWAVETLEGTWS